MVIKRDSYLNQLIMRKDNGMIKVITGIQRCGKSFLLFKIFKHYLMENGVDREHIIEIALDGIENEELRNPKVCYQYIKSMMHDEQKYYLFLDEVQFMPRFEEVLNSLAYDMDSEEKQIQEFSSLRNIPDSFKKIVIVNGTKKTVEKR